MSLKTIIPVGYLILVMISPPCRHDKKKQTGSKNEFPSEMVSFSPCKNNPVFSGTDSATWDRHIRERGYIIREEGLYKMWYSGYQEGDTAVKQLGYATSADGINWKRYSKSPVFHEKWTEDVFVIRHDGNYYLFAEGRNDIAHFMTSPDGIHWKEEGDLIIRQTAGEKIPGPYGTPVVWTEDGKWYLLYERNDLGIWLATSEDLINWTNIQDEPVIQMGPERYDAGAVAANQVVRYNDRYYLYYHGSTNPNWADPDEHAVWSSNMAVSDDLVHWKKYPGNPIVEGDHSSPILVFDGERYRLYTMHDKVWLYLPNDKE